MVDLVESLPGMCCEPFAGVVLARFDVREPSHATLGEMSVPAGSLARRPIRSFVLHCASGSCLVEAWGGAVEVGPQQACLVSVPVDATAHCRLQASPEFGGCLVGLSSREIPEATCNTFRSFDVDGHVFESGPWARDTLQVVQAQGQLAHAFAQVYVVSRRAGQGQLRLRCMELIAAIAETDWEAKESNSAASRPSHREIAHRAQEVMASDLSHPLTIAATAKLCGTSPTVLKQAFRETYGQSVHEWYRTCRVHHAASLLQNTSYSIARISSEVGYSNPSKFSKVFAEYMGASPSAWREQHRG